MTRETYRAKWAAISSSRWISVVVAVAVFAVPVSALSVAKKKEIARTQFENAERLREALNGRPAKDRTIRDYQRVIEAYRRVYYVAPTSAKADPSVMAVAELLVEEGRAFKSDDALKNAIGQYEFLRREYPGSKYRIEALFTIAQIYKDDLGDSGKAKETLQEFLKRYPNTQQSDDARAALKEIDDAAKQAAKTAAKPQDTPKAPEAEKAQVVQTVAQKDAPAENADHHARPLVTGIRHWSTPDYTRIAIDIEDEIIYDSGRISNPDRIYFDLKDTRLSSVLKGKIFEVDDGYLRKIRIGQFAPGLTRVVLEVGDDVGEYSAFLLPNPFRLIIDIHGKETKQLMARSQELKANTESKPNSSAEDLEKATAPKPTTKAEEQSRSVALNKPAAKKPGTRPESSAAKPEAKVQAPAQKPDSRAGSLAKKSEVEVEDVVEVVESKTTTKSETTAKKEVPKKIVEPDPEPARPEPVLVAKAPSPEPAVKEEPPVRIRGKKRQAPEKLNVHTARPTTDGERSLIRALGLKIGKIVVDAGHGGHDTGTIGPNGLEEKDLVLDVALRLGKLLENRLGADVIYTRDDDTFIPLETRTAIANQQQADLFISVHANSSRDQNARGVETYYLNFTSSSEALEVAARENAVSEKSIHELQDLVKKIALKDKIEESREFAQDVQQSLHTGLASKAPAIRNRGVKKAPFIVLIGANMPSILAEISFISNPSDERRLRTPEYRQKIAESLYRGVARYTSGLSGVKVAQKIDTGD
jgi:N-acetylmuramoyl-L-alanine amidase